MSQVGTAWTGRHVVMVHCNPLTNRLIKIDTSLHAPLEPPHQLCSETFSQLLSTGYQITAAVMLSTIHVIYIFVN
ncbi:hypothetical protein DS031_03270 [Bacillus taeanensis]|uniref:Uncharacterized protein n=1 Tax=Bacillus taeanensis TaxID=273032 RepID=A0A366XXP6_9BACI|nr:hypothetical protein DS031_03270 [Bacillus taeanensis]